jgi:hypothetical protein
VPSEWILDSFEGCRIFEVDIDIHWARFRYFCIFSAPLYALFDFLPIPLSRNIETEFVVIRINKNLLHIYRTFPKTRNTEERWQLRARRASGFGDYLLKPLSATLRI